MRLLTILTCFCLLADITASEPPCAHGTIRNGGLLLIDGNVNGKLIKGVVDTGASHHAYDKKLMSILKNVEPNEKKGSIRVCDPQCLQVGLLHDSIAAGSAIVDLEPFRRKSHLEIEAVFGIPMLAGRTIHICPSRREFNIDIESNSTGPSVPMHLDEFGRPCVYVSICGVEILSLIDTGSNAGITLNEIEFESALRRIKSDQQLTTVNVQDLSESVARRKLPSAEVSIGTTRIQDVELIESSSNKIGMSLLNRFETIVDMKNMQLVLRVPRPPSAYE